MEAQTSKILKLLRANKNGVANYKFPQNNILRYSARIADLRKDGFSIIAVRQIVNNKSTGVWVYHLMETTLEDYELNYEPTQKKDLFKGFKQLFKKETV